MLKYIGKRLIQSIFTLFVIITIVFSLLRLMPEEGYLGAAA
ncbi:MAG: ABC transporter permease, partial [Solibacillus sp.]